MGKFGWDLPPGCTAADIEAAFGGGESMLEAFEASKEGIDAAKETGVNPWDDDDVANYIEYAMAWAHSQGYRDANENRQEADALVLEYDDIKAAAEQLDREREV